MSHLTTSTPSPSLYTVPNRKPSEDVPSDNMVLTSALRDLQHRGSTSMKKAAGFKSDSAVPGAPGMGKEQKKCGREGIYWEQLDV